MNITSLEQIQPHLHHAKMNGHEFSISRVETKLLVETYGPTRVVQTVFDAVRSTNTSIIMPPVHGPHVDRLVRQACNATARMATPNQTFTFRGGPGNVQGTLLQVIPTSTQLSNVLSGDKRYAIRISTHGPTPLELWNNDAFLRKTIRDLCIHPSRQKEALSLGRIRVSCLGQKGARYATGFPIPVAICVYKEEARRRPNGVLSCVIDPCAGWSDRLAAAMVSGVVEHYVGMDPWHVSHAICQRTQQVIQPAVQALNVQTRVQLIQESALTAPWPEQADLVFTSPPFGDLECYNLDGPADDQQAWRVGNEHFADEFLVPLMAQAAASTRQKRGRVIISMGNAKKRGLRNLTDGLIAAAQAAGLVWVTTYGMEGRARDGATRCDPIFVFAHDD